MTTTNDAPAQAEGHLDESAVTTAMINAAFKVCPLDVAAELGTGAMQRIIAAAIAAQPAPSGSGVREALDIATNALERIAGVTGSPASVANHALNGIRALASDASPKEE